MQYCCVCRHYYCSFVNGVFSTVVDTDYDVVTSSQTKDFGYLGTSVLLQSLQGLFTQSLTCCTQVTIVPDKSIKRSTILEKAMKPPRIKLIVLRCAQPVNWIFLVRLRYFLFVPTIAVLVSTTTALLTVSYRRINRLHIILYLHSSRTSYECKLELVGNLP